jgi:hypothetical protein
MSVSAADPGRGTTADRLGTGDAAGESYDCEMGGLARWTYFDGNALTWLWDWYTEVHPEGQTGDAREASPFAHAVISDFVVDEIVTHQISDAYKKHVLLLAIFPDIPVLVSLESADLAAAQSHRELLLRPADFLAKVVTTRLLALAGHPEALRGLAEDIANKQSRIDADAARAIDYAPKHQRVPFDEAVTAAIQAQRLDPKHSAFDFFQLCTTLYSLEMRRFIDRSNRERKGASRSLNQQIDHYHLTYLPFVDEFVTNDAVLARTAADLVRIVGLQTVVHTTSSYLNEWLRGQLLAKDPGS